MLKTFTGWEYMLIDVCNQWGGDKELFEVRIEWAKRNLHRLEALAGEADNYPLYMKAVMAIRAVQRGEAVGHVVGFDAVCSGLQIMSVLTGCKAGAMATGLIDPNKRADAYTGLHKLMQKHLGNSVDIDRKQAKEALMTSLYGSKAKPVEIFGKDTPELNAFYQAAYELGPGAWELLQELLASWQPYALSHRWVLPDGFDVRVKVMKKIEAPDPRARIEVDELDHATFTYEYKINEGSKNGLSNVANVVHSVDAYIMRTMHRRCNYDRDTALIAYALIGGEQNSRLYTKDIGVAGPKVQYYIDHFDRSGMADVVILPYMIKEGCAGISDQHLAALAMIIESMTVHEPFELITVHDEFRAGPNHLNHLRQHYINILAELAESDLLSDIMSQIHGTQGKYAKLSNDLGDLIRNSNYALS